MGIPLKKLMKIYYFSKEEEFMEFKKLTGYPFSDYYEISSNGIVRRLRRIVKGNNMSNGIQLETIELKTRMTPNGVSYVRVKWEGTSYYIYIHKEVKKLWNQN